MLHSDVFVEEFKPVTQTEDCLVEELAVAKWRIDRVRTAQHRALANIDLDTAMDDDKLARKMNNLHRYENQYRRQFDRALKQLQEIRAIEQKERKAEADAREQEMINRERRARTLLAIRKRNHTQAIEQMLFAPIPNIRQNEPDTPIHTARASKRLNLNSNPQPQGGGQSLRESVPPSRNRTGGTDHSSLTSRITRGLCPFSFRGERAILHASFRTGIPRSAVCEDSNSFS